MSIVTYPGRVRSYLDNPTGKRLPFSCTLGVLDITAKVSEFLGFATHSLKAGSGVKLIIAESFRLPEPKHFDLEFSIDPATNATEGYHTITIHDNIESIAQGLVKLENAVENGATKINIDLSRLRPEGTVNSDGLIASGPTQFSELYRALQVYLTKPSMHSLLRLLGLLNEVILRGGLKRGIITSAIHSNSPYTEEYLDVPLVSLRGAHKKGIIFAKDFLDKASYGLLEKICDKINKEALFLQKEHQEPGLYTNVCQGIYLNDRGTCLLVRINLSQVEPDNLEAIVDAYKEATAEAIVLASSWRSKSTKAMIWAPFEEDLQVSIDPMGLANLLGRLSMSYQEFVDAMKDPETNNGLVLTLRRAYKASVEISNIVCGDLGIRPMQRLHSVEPAQTHSYQEVDTEGFTTCRGIWPPFTRIVNRMSDTKDIRTYDHGPNIETHISPELHFDLCNEWQKMMNQYGLPHAISYDTWVDFNLENLYNWYGSELTTLYYNMSSDYNDDFSRKSFKVASLFNDECSVCAE